MHKQNCVFISIKVQMIMGLCILNLTAIAKLPSKGIVPIDIPSTMLESACVCIPPSIQRMSKHYFFAQLADKKWYLI